MEEIIITLCTLVIFGMGAITAPVVVEKQEKRKIRKVEQAKVDAWQARLERAKAEREAHPERFQAGQVPGVGKDGIYVV